MIVKTPKGTYVLNCDWLQFSVQLPEREPELLCPDGYRIELLPGNNIYKNRMQLFDLEGRKWLTMLWNPYSSVLDPLIATIQMANWVLYSDMIGQVFEVLQQIVYVEYNNMGRIDLCLDFIMDERLLDVWKNLRTGSYYVQGKKEGSGFWHDAAKKDTSFFKMLDHCQSWGSKSSEVKVKVYYKSREQGVAANENAHPEKPWIVNEWRYADMDVTQVWRIEFSLSGASCLRYNDRLITLEDVQSGAWLCQILADLLDSRFIVRMNQGKRDGHKNLDKKIDFITLPWKGVKLQWAETKEKAPASDSIVMLRRLLGTLELAPCRCNEEVFQGVASTILQLVHDEHLERYFDDKVGGNVEAYLDNLWQETGAGIHQVTQNPSMLWE